MELNEFPMFSADVLTLATDENITGFHINHSVTIITYQDGWMVVQGSERAVVRCDVSEQSLFGRLVMRDQVRWMLTAQKKGRLLVQYCAPVEVSPMALEMGVDGLIADDLFTKQEIADNSIEQACQWAVRTFVVSGLAEGDWLSIARFTNSSSRGGFQLLGNGWRADIEETRDNGLLVKRVTRHLRRDGAFSLLVGRFSFRDASVAAKLNSASQQAVLSAVLRDSASYLELWNLYNDKEWQDALKKAETLKCLRFVESEGFQDGRENAWRLTPKSQEAYLEFRERWKELELSRDTQVDLGAAPPDWAEELGSDESDQSAAATPRGTVRFESNSVVFTPASSRRGVKPKPSDCWLYLSMAGYRTVGKRRLAAKRSIDSGKRLPQLKWLLEGVGVSAERRRPIRGLTPYAKETFKGGRPTEKQTLALEIALNTPDLAIIIGPPGTGKTQVIAALQRRLAEEAEGQNIAGQVLISSFQHDAVDNALDRSDVFNLPATRVGGKRSDGDEDNLDPWFERQATHLRERISTEYAKYPELERIKLLSQTLAMTRITRCTQIELAEAFTDMLAMARDLEMHGLLLSASLEQQLEEYVAKLRAHAPKCNDGLMNRTALRRIRALRVESIAFSDDGAERAWDLLSWLRRHDENLSGELRELLQEAADNQHVCDSLLNRLVVGKNALLDQFLPDYRPSELKHHLDEEGLKLIDQLERHLESKVTQRKQGVAWALEQLAASMEMDRTAAMATAEEYSMVIGATCQQAASQKMANLKSVTALDSSDIEFDTVVVDEAARANPLDLFIPMSMAKRRIVLLGDDRQLPHMLEPDIESHLQEEHQLTEQQLAAFRSSLFERLRLMLQDLEKRDSIRRVVMLDTQFRMHPVLGDFVSEQFYETVGLEKVRTTREAKEFDFGSSFLCALSGHEIFYKDKVCRWIDVPASAGTDGKRGTTSRVREVEADRVVEEVKRLMEAGGESVSVGVITFYAAQRELIMEKLTQVEVNGVPLMERRNGSIEPHEQFKWARKTKADGSVAIEERLRVGSVDAFQGKEFDVVLLSCVRTYKAAKRLPEQLDEAQSSESRDKQLNRQFGFLRLPNRMNVAMSRQRQMLICVGDAAMATNADAKDAVPALAAFYALCGGAHGSIC